MIARIARSIVTIVVLFIVLLPIYWMVSASLMPTGAANTYPPRLFPRTVTLEHYRAIFTRLEMGRPS